MTLPKTLLIITYPSLSLVSGALITGAKSPGPHSIFGTVNFRLFGTSYQNDLINSFYSEEPYLPNLYFAQQIDETIYLARTTSNFKDKASISGIIVDT